MGWAGSILLFEYFSEFRDEFNVRRFIHVQQYTRTNFEIVDTLDFFKRYRTKYPQKGFAFRERWWSALIMCQQNLYLLSDSYFRLVVDPDINTRV
jgi:hypothetical protein